MVQASQGWLNATYRGVTGYTVIPEDGVTGWATMYALTRALQHELGITALSNSFGNATLAALQAQFPVVNKETARTNIINIVQAALWCKGYMGNLSGKAVSGMYDSTTESSVERLKTDMGVKTVYPAAGLGPKPFKGLLTMDPYVLDSGGSSTVRTAQQWLNGRYVRRRDFFIVPCQGVFSRETQKALMLAVQFELGMSDDAATGAFGPATQDGLRTRGLVKLGSADTTTTFVRLFQAALNFNTYSAPFTGTFDAATRTQVTSFQTFSALAPVNGEGDYKTWASLLVSTGDSTRAAKACDTVTTITAVRATTLRTAGYQIVGRYLTNATSSTLNKKIQPGEVATIQDAGLSLFPIYQTFGGSATYFGATQGAADCRAAIAAARYHGFPIGTTIYFAVDFDAVDEEIRSNLFPHFAAIKGEMARYGGEYTVGIYGSRNVCSRVAGAGHSSSSFVSGMSSGFSGNLGFPLPKDWAFDQIATTTVGTAPAAVTIDKVVTSGRNAGVRGLPTSNNAAVADRLLPASQRALLEADLVAYMIKIGQPSPVGAKLSREAAATLVVGFDEWVTRLSNTYGIRKALIQAPALWETRGRATEDIVLDAVIYDYWVARAGYEAGVHSVPPIPPPRTDSSTGTCAIFGWRAASSFNAMITALRNGGVTTDAALRRAMPMVDVYNSSRTFDSNGVGGKPLQLREYDRYNWSDLSDMWCALYTSNAFSIGMAALVLLQAADEASPRIQPRAQLDYRPEDLTQIIRLYNGTGQTAADFGVWVGGIYTVFEKYHAPARTL